MGDGAGEREAGRELRRVGGAGQQMLVQTWAPTPRGGEAKELPPHLHVPWHVPFLELQVVYEHIRSLGVGLILLVGEDQARRVAQTRLGRVEQLVQLLTNLMQAEVIIRVDDRDEGICGVAVLRPELAHHGLSAHVEQRDRHPAYPHLSHGEADSGERVAHRAGRLLCELFHDGGLARAVKADEDHPLCSTTGGEHGGGGEEGREREEGGEMEGRVLLTLESNRFAGNACLK